MPHLPSSAEKFAEADRLARQLLEIRAQEKAARALARKIQALERAAGVAPGAVMATKSEMRRAGLPLGTQYSTHSRMDTSPEVTGRRGPELKSDGPVALAARNSGKSMLTVASEVGAPSYNAAKQWNRRKSAPAWARARLAAAPYLVPATAWKS